MTENRPKPGPRPVEYPSFLKKRRAADNAVVTESAHIAGSTASVGDLEVSKPLNGAGTAHSAALPLPEERLRRQLPVVAAEDPGLTRKSWRSHPAFAPRPAQPKIVEATSTKSWREHPAFVFRSQPKSPVPDSALTIKQPSEVAHLAPPVTRPPGGLHLPQKTVKAAPPQVATRSPTIGVSLPTPVLTRNPSAPPKPVTRPPWLPRRPR